MKLVKLILYLIVYAALFVVLWVAERFFLGYEGLAVLAVVLLVHIAFHVGQSTLTKEEPKHDYAVEPPPFRKVTLDEIERG
jgi:hypothetical protein